MRARLSTWWYDLGQSLWFVPAVMTAMAVALALGTVRLDQALLLDRRTGATWLFGGGAEGARGVLAAIAGTMITVTGVVFSITIVALQLASGQFSPRVLRTFTGDRGNQVVLGAFIGTFTYALLVLRSVRSASDDGALFVPSASVTLAIVLALCSIGLLIFYIHHAASSIRASVVIDRAARDTVGLIDDLFPADVGRPAPPPAFDPEAAPAACVRAAGGGYLQTIDEDALFDLAEAGSLTVRPAPRVGEFVLPGALLADVWPAAALDADPKLADAIRGACILGFERTLRADVELGLRQLADIAVKALSPGINDPTTATICVDRLAEALVRLANRAQPREVRTGKDGAVRLVLHGPPFDRLVGVAFDQIRHYGAGDATVAAHLATALGRMASLVPPTRREPLRAQADLVLAGARERIPIPADLERVERAGAWTQTGVAVWR